ncbi:MAG: thermonuclease family protein [Bauldia sp.]
MRTARTVLALLPLLLFAGPLAAAEVSGAATAVDSDVIQIGGKRVLLWAIESVERKQTCKMNGADWACWDDAMAALNKIVKSAPTVRCEQVGDPDVFGRVLGTCFVGVLNVNKEMVSQGWAVAKVNESKDYVADQAYAKDNKLGLWKGTFQMPPEFRAAAGIFVERP